ncbi:hypothetical protein LTR53_007152 [Teratosphaeriaceae sp. CCFEE 6253]|nr:hypothetical protein LTR53_007152 [Teratosphaeriaceae sp. CCFEE 6253]
MAVEPQDQDASIHSSPTPPLEGATQNSSGPSTKVLRRACDCCRKRKVKCDGLDPCTPCTKAAIRCAYLQPPKKKGPKGLRSARVLHALRRIDDTVSGSSAAPENAGHHGAFGNWGWSSATSPVTKQPSAWAPPTSVSPDEAYHHQLAPTSLPTNPRSHDLPQPLVQPALYRSDTQHSTWSLQTAPEPAPDNTRMVLPPILSNNFPQRMTGDSFSPYMQLFFEHMFPIMPILDQNFYLDPRLYADPRALGLDQYCLLCALCAATIVQLDASVPQPASLHTKAMDDVFAEECVRERKGYDYVAPTSTLSCMTSFFLFTYYGNHENHTKAWFYLQEAITFSQMLNMDDEETYTKLDPVEAGWRRRMYWLLFVTERAYAVQRRKHTRLHASVNLPAVFDHEDPHLLNGFVNLANLFSAVDDSFVSAWRGSRRQSLCDEAWLAKTQKRLDAATLALDDISETQHLDISVTREWLHVLAWQIGVSNGLIWGKGEAGMRLDYPIELARKVVGITSGAHALALDSHGIGMEQKLSDIAGCVADVLRCTAGDTSATFMEGKRYLNILLQKLSSIRGKESRYLKPLMSKMEGLMDYDLSNHTLLLPTETAAGGYGQQHAGHEYLNAPVSRTISMADSVGMLRTLSMSGNLGMPFLMVSGDEWQQRRPSGRMWDEGESCPLGGGPWNMGGLVDAV